MRLHKINVVCCVLIGFGLLYPYHLRAQIFKRTKAKTEKASAKKKSAYETIVTDSAYQVSKSDFLTLYLKDGKIKVEIPQTTLGIDMLMAATVTSLSNPNLAIIGHKPSSPEQFRLIKKGENVVLQSVRQSVIGFRPDLSPNDTLFRSSFRDAEMANFKIEAYNADSTSVVIDMTSFFTGENKLFPIIEKSVGGLSLSTTPRTDLDRIIGIKSFSNNARIVVENNLTAQLNARSKVIRENYPITYTVTYSLLQVPKRPMVPRMADNRIGVFQTRIGVQDPKTGKLENVSFVNRWRLEPKDTAAYLRGELTEVIKPIVFYVDNAFPQAWLQPIHEAVLNWNKAFEKIGFKNVMQVRDFPTDDPQFDPNDLNYSCIRYVPQNIENAFGPSWVDVRSGEIINASVFVYADVAKLINSWRFIQTAQVDSSVRSGRLPKEVFNQALKYVVTHEIGHTLGFMHNMVASASFPVDSLRSATFTQKYGTTPSIMDYARFNYVAQPTDEGVKVTPPDLGIYDYYLVDWTYRAFPKAKGDFRAEAAILDSLVESHVKDPHYKYVMQQFGDRRYDPSAIEEDLGDNAMKASEYGLKNLKYIIAHMDKWVSDDADGSLKKNFYQEIVYQAYRYLNNVAMNIGGIHVHPTSEKSGLPRYEVVDKETQRASAKWLLKAVREYPTMGNELLELNMDEVNRPFELGGGSVRNLLFSRIMAVSGSYYMDKNSYSQLEYLEDLYQDIFRTAIHRETKITEQDKQLQKNFVNLLLRVVSASRVSGGRSSIAFADGLLGDIDTCTHTDFCGTAHHLHSTATTPFETSFGSGYGENQDLWLASVDATQINLFLYSRKVKELLQGAVRNAANSELKLHYEYLLRQLQQAEE